MSAGGWLIDAGVGEVRAARLDAAGAIAALLVHRPHEPHAPCGALYAARVRRVERALRGAFLDLGAGPDGFLRLERAAPAPAEGAALSVRVMREAAGAKGPVVQLAGAATEAKPGLLAPPPDAFWVNPPAHDRDVRVRLDEAFAAALETIAPVPGGGRLSIEPTAALTAIDVDAHERKGAGDPETFALDLNLAAGRAALRQLQLRSLGGITAIDFLALRKPESRARLMAGLAGEAKAVDAVLAPLSRFGVLELSRPQTFAPLWRRMAGPEAHAWAALRAIEREAAAARGRIIHARVAPTTAGFLARAGFDWRQALVARIGARWTLEAGEAVPAAGVDIRVE